MNRRFEIRSQQKSKVLAIAPNDKSNQAVEILSKLDNNKSITHTDKIYYITFQISL